MDAKDESGDGNEIADRKPERHIELRYKVP